jgi:hypothetical protein
MLLSGALAFASNAPPPLAPGLKYGSQYYAVAQEGYIYTISQSGAAARCALLSKDAVATVEPVAYALVDMARCTQKKATVVSCTYTSDEATIADFAAWVDAYPPPKPDGACTDRMELVYFGRVIENAIPSPPSLPAPPLGPQLAYGSGYYAISQEIWDFTPSEDAVLSRCTALWPAAERLTATIEDASQALIDSPTCTSRWAARVSTCTFTDSTAAVSEFAATGFAQRVATLPEPTEAPFLCATMELVDWGRSTVAAAKPRPLPSPPPPPPSAPPLPPHAPSPPYLPPLRPPTPPSPPVVPPDPPSPPATVQIASQPLCHPTCASFYDLNPARTARIRTTLAIRLHPTW